MYYIMYRALPPSRQFPFLVALIPFLVALIPGCRPRIATLLLSFLHPLCILQKSLVAQEKATHCCSVPLPLTSAAPLHTAE